MTGSFGNDFVGTERYGDSTRAVKAVEGEAIPGQPVSGFPVPASAFHLSDDEGSESHVYGRYSNPTWSRLESALELVFAQRIALRINFLSQLSLQIFQPLRRVALLRMVSSCPFAGLFPPAPPPQPQTRGLRWVNTACAAEGSDRTTSTRTTQEMASGARRDGCGS